MISAHPTGIPAAKQTLAYFRDRLKQGSLDAADRQQLHAATGVGMQALWRKLVQQEAAEQSEQVRLQQLLRYEKPLWAAGLELVAGVDEVGVGPLAGPVVAAAVILPANIGGALLGLDDSKKVSAAKREALAKQIQKIAVACSIGRCDVQEIDGRNIFWASREAARRAVAGLPQPPEHVLVDAYRVPGIDCAQTPILGGDGLSQSIAAASIVAKVARDAWMHQLDDRYPGYGFAKHMGYGTRQHLEALQRLGPVACHRTSFAPVAQALQRSA